MSKLQNPSAIKTKLNPPTGGGNISNPMVGKNTGNRLWLRTRRRMRKQTFRGIR